MTKTFGDKAYSSYKQQNTEDKIYKLFNDRITKIENAVFKHGKTPSSMGQQLLMLNELGILDHLKQFKLSNVKLGRLLGSILNTSPENIRQELSNVNLKDSGLKTSTNYAYLQKVYEDSGLEDLFIKADLEYTRLSDQEKRKIKIKKT